MPYDVANTHTHTHTQNTIHLQSREQTEEAQEKNPGRPSGGDSSNSGKEDSRWTRGAIVEMEDWDAF